MHYQDYSSLFYHNPLPNWIYEIQSMRILDVNDAALSHYGYSKEEFLSMTIKQLRPKEEVPKLISAHSDIDQKSGNIRFGIFKHQKKNGEIMLMEVHGHKVIFQGLEAIMVSCLDVTEKERQLKELEDSKALIQEATSIAKLGYWSTDLRTNEFIWSEEVYKIWEVDPQVFKPDFDIFYQSIHADDRAEFDYLQPLALSGERSFDFVHRIYTPSGKIKWVHEKGRVKFDEKGVPISFSGTAQDITAQKEEEQHLKLLESVITHTDDIVMITEAEPLESPGPRIQYVNQAFTKLTGYTLEEVKGQSPRILQGPKSDLSELGRLKKALQNWESCEITTINYKKNGEEFWVNLAVTPVANEKGWFTHWIAIERDVTKEKQKQLRKELLTKISTAFSEKSDLQSALNQVCDLVSEFANLTLCEVWLPDIHQKNLRLLGKSVRLEISKLFYADEEQIGQIAMGKGLPGMVLKNGSAQFWNHQDKASKFFRKNAAKQTGLKSAFGIPLRYQNEVIGVMILGTNSDGAFLSNQMILLEQLETFLGVEIYRKRIENDLHHLFESLPDLVCLMDFQGHFIKINQAGCELLGYSENDIQGKPFNEFVHPADKEYSMRHFAKLVEKGGEILKFENKVITRSGKAVWLDWHGNAILEDGLIYATAKNISEEKKLRQIVDDASHLASIGGWEIDQSTGEVYWSPVIHEIHETDPDFFNPDLATGINFYREDYQEIVASIITKAQKTEETFEFEAAIITAKGNEKWVKCIGRSEILRGECIRVFGSFQDITQLKTTQFQLHSLSNDLPGVVFQYFMFPDGTDRLQSVSQAARKIWEISPEDCEKDTQIIWNQIKAGGDYEQVLKDIQHSLSNQTQWHSKWRNILPSGEIRWHEGFGTPYFFPDQTIMFNSMVFDITDEVKSKMLYEETSELAKIGSWELDLSKSDTSEFMYWSPMVKKILEVNPDYNPSLSGGYEFYTPDSYGKIKKAVETLIATGTSFDEELMVKTAKGNFRWVRCIGEGEFIQGNCVRIFGSYQDIQDKKSLDIRMSEILGSISDAFYAMDSQWNFTYFNKEAELLLQRKKEEVIGENIWEVFPAARGTVLQELYQRVADTGQNESFEYFYPGDNCWYDVNAYASQNGVSVYFKNIDERKRAAEELKKAYEERNEILESIGDAFFAVDNDWIVTYWNRVAEQVLFKNKEEILGKNLWVEYADAVDSDFYRMYHRAKETNEILSFEEHYPTLGKWFEVTAYPSPKGLSVYFKDVTLRKATDLIIREANERFERVTEATTDAIWDWDISKDIYYRGNGFQRLFGYEPQKILKRTDFWKDNFHPEDVDAIKESVEEALANPETRLWELEYRILHPSGTTKTVLDKGIIIRDDQGKPIRMVGAITDITYRKEYERELKRLNADLIKNIYDLQLANEELEQFAFITSHDLQEPLRMISSFMDQLRRKYGDQLDDRAHQYIHYAIDGAKRMKHIILDLLEYSRAGRLKEPNEIVDPNLIVEDYLVLRKKIIQEKSAQISYDPLPKIKTAKVPLTQVFHCLLDNAIKYSKPDIAPQIFVSVREMEDAWQFMVQDNGIGIDPEFFHKIFVIFQRLHNREEFEGTGIGLALVKKQIESRGGKVWVESEVGKGSTFYFSLKKENNTSEPNQLNLS